MSRETDSPSSGPNGRGGAAYPSGTPPYGTPMASDDGTDAGRSASQSEERKTETTLTTRIRINIPGSRPIPPVVVRTPVADAEGTAGDTTAETPAPSAPVADSAAHGTVEAPAEPAPSAEEKTSDWFAPRKSGPAKGGQGGGATNGAGLPGGSAPAPAASGAAPGAPAGAAPGGARPGAGRPGGVVGSMSVPGGSRSGSTNGAGLPGATGGPVAPGHGGGTGSFDVTEALAAGPLGGGSRPGGEPRRDDLPYFSDNDGAQNAHSGQNGPVGQNGYGAQGGLPGGADDFNSSTGSHRFPPANDFNGPNDFGGPAGYGGPQGPAGPTGGPVTGDGPVVPPVGGPRVGPGGPGAPGGQRRQGGPGVPGAASASTGFAGPGVTAPPGAPGAGPQGGPGRGPGGGLSDDTAILTPQKPAPEPGTPGYGTPPDNVSGHTVTSGIPVVPSTGQNSPFGPGPGTDGPLPHTPPKLPEPVAQNVPASSKKKPKKKGRSKLTLVGVGVVVVAGGAYGAGLLMNHSDVPKGTTVLGVDIGGGTRDDAVKKLDAAFDKKVNEPLKLSVDGRTVQLQPDQAGLQFDMQATVSKAATSDYNPVSVIGSLFGGQRVIEPEMPVDEEKLTAALEDASGSSGSATEGTIKFKNGKAVAVYGKAGKGIDVARSTTSVEQAYRTQVETGSAGAVTLPTTTKQPTISNAEVDAMMKSIAEPAMAQTVQVQTDAAHFIKFGQLSLPDILSFKAVDGKLVDYYDLKALKAAYGTTFAGVQINGASGKRDVLPEDVASALRKALRGKSTAERVVTIDTDPS
ncbi:hypothetical protein ACIHIX_01795 [Streptomyces sp. NPDC051913]|uniref:hypothetical protein n=1 Tax=Streptomyces sp. NPDC051913 TaxID=3365676 RepID=UPI0037CE9B5B